MKKINNIEELMKKLPIGYKEECHKQKAITRKRNIKSPENLMKLSLIYLTQNCSLEEISYLSEAMELGKISNVGFMKKFAKCGDWFKKILEEIKPKEIANFKKPKSLEKYTFVALDASDVTEKGAIKRIWRLHYSINIFNMNSLEYKITSEKTGESLTNFTIKPDYLVLGDRAYATKKGIEYCLLNKGDFIFRIKNNAFKLYDKDKNEIKLINYLEKINDINAENIEVYMESSNKKLIPLRICAIKKKPKSIANSVHKIKKFQSRKQLELSEETKETHKYFFVITSLPKSVKADEIISLYALRWQIELSFKKLKSIMNFGDLPKKKESSVIAWLNGKLMVALLLEKLLSQAIFPPIKKFI